MKRIEMEPIVKKYYDALDEGKVLGRKCKKCNHIEFPPYLACNACGNLDTEWVDLTDTRAHIGQILPPLLVFPEAEFRDDNGGFMAIDVLIDNADPYVTSLVHVDPERYDELHDNMEDVIVKPFIIEGEDRKICSWVLEDFVPTAEDLAPKKKRQHNDDPYATSSTSTAAKPESFDCDNDPLFQELAKTVIECAAEGYGVDESEITLDTDIRLDLSNESMKMIAMIAGIEEELDVTVDIQEAGNLNTIREFVLAVKEKM